MKKFTTFIFLSCALSASTVSLYAAEPLVFHKNIELETGDTWKVDGKKYRLYGAQSCIRGTKAIIGTKEYDCGAISLAYLGAIFEATPVTCESIATGIDQASIVVCKATISETPLDLGKAMIAAGYSFAAFDDKGGVLSKDYLIAEIVAKRQKSGLWAGVFTHPNDVLYRSK